ncbi:DUF4397 domain-containing protein [Halobaculum limi]|uniref:DUF4397 domain-containing protein n=1 Tax=Halobaculum limi TaxID=3031916 RepID=UPI002405BB10|nr:DUF4397 domain-containing protein [Halobaculum sp. YSMS11]
MRQQLTARLAVVLAAVLVGSVVLTGAAFAGPTASAPQPTANVAVQEDGPTTQETAYLRIVHASPDAPAVDVLVNNETVADDLAFGNSTGYLEVGAGDYNVTVTTADGETVVYEGSLTVPPRSITTIAASGEVGENATEPFDLVTYSDDAYTPEEEEAAISVIHLSPDAPAVDVTVEGTDVVLADNVSFGDATDYLTVPEGEYTVEIRAASEDNNGTVVATVDVELDEETAYTAYAVGYLDPPSENASSFGVLLTEDATRTVELPDGPNGPPVDPGPPEDPGPDGDDDDDDEDDEDEDEEDENDEGEEEEESEE